MPDKAFDDLLPVITATALRGEPVGRDELLAVLASSDDDLLDMIAAASRRRQRRSTSS
jgi:biotin synthase